MKGCYVFLVVLTTVFAFICFALSIQDSLSFTPIGLASQRQVTFNKATFKGMETSSNHKMDEEDTAADLNDYRPIDPSPSSKASIRPKPTQHGTPYMPYIPKLSPPPPPPTPPGHPKQDLLP